MEEVLLTFFMSLEHTYLYLWQAVAATNIVSLNLEGLWAGIVTQFQDHSGRVVWLLIAALVGSGAIFMFSMGVVLLEAVIITEPKRRKFKKVPPPPPPIHQAPKSTKEIQEQLTKTISWAKENASHSVIDKLKSGNVSAAEKELIAERIKRPKDVGLIMYMLAFRAMRNDGKSYDSLVDSIFPNGLKADTEICRHAAELGRLLSPDKYPVSEYPPPETIFEFDIELIGDTLGPISEFASVHTLLDLIRIYFEMHDFDQIRHLIVIVLVCGNTQERETAIHFAKMVAPRAHS